LRQSWRSASSCCGKSKQLCLPVHACTSACFLPGPRLPTNCSLLGPIRTPTCARLAPPLLHCSPLLHSTTTVAGVALRAPAYTPSLTPPPPPPHPRYISIVKLRRPRAVSSRVANSALFHRLDSTWSMDPGIVPKSCWLTFHVDFAFQRATYNHIVSMFFSEVRLGLVQQPCAPVHVLHMCIPGTIGPLCDVGAPK